MPMKRAMILAQKSGFTLIEVLVAISLLSIGLLGVANLTIGIIKGNSYSKNVTTATIVAQQQIDQAQRLGYTNASGLHNEVITVSMGGKELYQNHDRHCRESGGEHESRVRRGFMESRK